MKSCPKLKSIHFPDLSRFGYEYFQKLDQFLASYAMQLENIDFNNLPGDGQLIVYGLFIEEYCFCLNWRSHKWYFLNL
jgi:hypothetical protein